MLVILQQPGIAAADVGRGLVMPERVGELGPQLDIDTSTAKVCRAVL
jgi:hypothetical protein